MMIKRICALVLTLMSLSFLMVGFCSCGEDGETFGVVYKDVTIELDKDAKDVLTGLGTPKSKENLPSCGTGPRTKYEYKDIYVYTVNSNGTEKIDEIKFKNDLVVTSKNVTIGSTEDEVKKAYGDLLSEEGGNLVCRSGKLELFFTIKNGVVSGVRYNRSAK